MPHRRTPRRAAVAAATVAALVAATGLATLLPGGAAPASAAGLVPYTGCAELLAHHRGALLAGASAHGFAGGPGGEVAAVAEDTAAAPVGARASGDQSTGAAVGRGATGTNLQEQDVDEPDSVKLRDGRLVVLARSRLSVVTASATPTVVSSLPLGPDVHGGELLLTGDRALLVLPTYGAAPGGDAGRSTWLPPTATRLVLVDLAHPGDPQVLEEARYDGRYLSARLVEGTVRLVTASTPVPQAAYPQAPGPVAEQRALAANRRTAQQLPLEAVLPQVVRTSGSGRLLSRGPALECGQVTRAAEDAGTSTLLVTTLRPQDGLAATDSTAVTAHGDVVYASADRLYVATSRWGTTAPVPLDDTLDEQVSTQLHAFDTTAPRSTRYVGSGSVPGYVLGRWALSEHEGALRVATTRQPPWGGEEKTSSSVFVLAERGGALVETGRVDGLGRDERIYAVRWFGDLAAVVTFRETDPLYLVDLSDPAAPTVLGELKVPGFSTYLHPLGDGLLLGLGQDADAQGRTTGVQLSVFDVRDLTAPVQVDRLSLGEGWSPALDDSRAFGYDPERRLATLPFMTWDGRGGTAAALGVRVGADGSLSEAGRLQVHPGTPPHRVLSDGALVFSVSESGVAAGDAETLTRTGAVDLPG